MKVALASSVVPFVGGGARFIVEWLEEKLREHGHNVEQIYLPFTENTPQEIFDQMAAYRLIDCAAADRLITFRPPAHIIPHANKIIWFIHHIRSFYDLWETPMRSFPQTPANKAFRAQLFIADNVALREAKRVFTNSQTVSDRLLAFNGITSEPLYPPLAAPERFRCDEHGDYIVYISRIEPVKRQDLLVRAMQFVKSAVKVRIYGESISPLYIQEIHNTISQLQLQEAVLFSPRWLAEDDKVGILAGSLAAAYFPVDEEFLRLPVLGSFPFLQTGAHDQRFRRGT